MVSSSLSLGQESWAPDLTPGSSIHDLPMMQMEKMGPEQVNDNPRTPDTGQSQLCSSAKLMEGPSQLHKGQCDFTLRLCKQGAGNTAAKGEASRQHLPLAVRGRTHHSAPHCEAPDETKRTSCLILRSALFLVTRINSFLATFHVSLKEAPQ